MKRRDGIVFFDTIDARDLELVANELGATINQLRYALHFALRRTEAALRKNATTELKRELGLRTAVALRSRIKKLKIRSSMVMQRNGESRGEVGLWFGLNELPVSAFKGTPKQDYAGAFMNDYFFEDGFVAKSEYSNKKTIFKRAGKRRTPIREQTIAIHQQGMDYIEDNLFERAEDMFWQHFRRDLAARVKYQIGGL